MNCCNNTHHHPIYTRHLSSVLPAAHPSLDPSPSIPLIFGWSAAKIPPHKPPSARRPPTSTRLAVRSRLTGIGNRLVRRDDRVPRHRRVLALEPEEGDAGRVLAVVGGEVERERLDGGELGGPGGWGEWVSGLVVGGLEGGGGWGCSGEEA